MGDPDFKSWTKEQHKADRIKRLRAWLEYYTTFSPEKIEETIILEEEEWERLGC